MVRTCRRLGRRHPQLPPRCSCDTPLPATLDSSHKTDLAAARGRRRRRAVRGRPGGGGGAGGGRGRRAVCEAPLPLAAPCSAACACSTCLLCAHACCAPMPAVALLCPAVQVRLYEGEAAGPLGLTGGKAAAGADPKQRLQARQAGCSGRACLRASQLPAPGAQSRHISAARRALHGCRPPPPCTQTLLSGLVDVPLIMETMRGAIGRAAVYARP